MSEVARKWWVVLVLVALCLPAGLALADDDRRDRGRDRTDRQDRRERQEQVVPEARGGRMYEQLRRERDRLDAEQRRTFEQLRREQYRDYRERRYDRRDRYVPPRRDFYRRGYRLPALPPAHTRIVIGADIFFYWDGIFFSTRNGGYVVVSAPIGARVRYLPRGYVSFYIGPTRYFYVNTTYYVWDLPTREYVVVEKPRGAERAMSGAEAGPDDLFVYPAQGQSEAQRRQDRYECYEWAVDETGYDPVDAGASSSGREGYLRALGACLEGRGYTVR